GGVDAIWPSLSSRGGSGTGSQCVALRSAPPSRLRIGPLPMRDPTPRHHCPPLSRQPTMKVPPTGAVSMGSHVGPLSPAAISCHLLSGVDKQHHGNPFSTAIGFTVE